MHRDGQLQHSISFMLPEYSIFFVYTITIINSIGSLKYTASRLSIELSHDLRDIHVQAASMKTFVSSRQEAWLSSFFSQKSIYGLAILLWFLVCSRVRVFSCRVSPHDYTSSTNRIFSPFNWIASAHNPSLLWSFAIVDSSLLYRDYLFCNLATSRT